MRGAPARGYRPQWRRLVADACGGSGAPAPAAQASAQAAEALRPVGGQTTFLLFSLGIIAVPIMAIMLLLASREDIMGRFVILPRLRRLGWIATAVMAITVVAMIATT